MCLVCFYSDEHTVWLLCGPRDAQLILASVCALHPVPVYQLLLAPVVLFWACPFPYLGPNKVVYSLHLPVIVLHSVIINLHGCWSTS